MDNQFKDLLELKAEIENDIKELENDISTLEKNLSIFEESIVEPEMEVILKPLLQKMYNQIAERKEVIKKLKEKVKWII